MTTFSPKTVRGKLLFAYMALIFIFTAAGVLITAQISNLRTSSHEFFSQYSQVEDLIISSRYMVDQISNRVLSPGVPDEVDKYIDRTNSELATFATQYELSILPESQAREIAAAIRHYALTVSVPLLLKQTPVQLMEEADSIAEQCMKQAEEIHKAPIVNAIAGIVDAYTDTLLTNDPDEREEFDELVRFIENHPAYGRIGSFPLLKEKALDVFEANSRYVAALSEFLQTSEKLSQQLVDIDKMFHNEFLLPSQDQLTGQMTRVAWMVVLSLVFSIFIATVVSLLLARRIWRPLQNMGDMVARMSAGELNHRLNTEAEDEMAEIGIAMNSFADQLKESMERLDDQMVEMSIVEAELRKSDQYSRALSKEYQVVLDGISESLVVVNQERNIVWSNKKASEEFFSEIDRRVVDADHALDADSTYYLGADQVDLCFNTGEKVEDLIQLANEKYYRVKVFPLLNEEGEVERVLKVMNDVSEQYLLNEEANRSNRLASLGELSAGVAHEINNPNSLVIVNSPIVRDAFEDIIPILERHYEEHGDFDLGGISFQRLKYDLPLMLKEMHEGSMRIQRIVEDLKNFVRKDGQALFEKIDINIAVETGVRLVKSMVNKSTNNFSQDLNKRLPLVIGNSVQLEQVVVNLIQNACLALPDRDRAVTVKTSLSEDGEYVVLSVRDEGVGISPENLQRITDPFFTTRRQDGGTGLGLSVTNRIVSDHNGTITFDSAPGEWTEVTVKFPVLN